MLDGPAVLFSAKPSLRRAFFYAALSMGTALYGWYTADLHPRFNPFWWSVFGVLAALLFAAYVRRWTSSYRITSEEIQASTGILSRRTTIVPLERVTNATARQSLLERILGLVNLEIDSAGGNKKEMVFNRILSSEGAEASRVIRRLRGKESVNFADHIQQRGDVAVGE